MWLFGSKCNQPLLHEMPPTHINLMPEGRGGGGNCVHYEDHLCINNVLHTYIPHRLELLSVSSRRHPVLFNLWELYVGAINAVHVCAGYSEWEGTRGKFSNTGMWHRRVRVEGSLDLVIPYNCTPFLDMQSLALALHNWGGVTVHLIHFTSLFLTFD